MTKMKDGTIEIWERRGFTLIELLVTTSIIMLLLMILLPSLRMARATARSTKCAANLRSIGLALTVYLSESGRGNYPPSYAYPQDNTGCWNAVNQPNETGIPGNGYVHWSWMLFAHERVSPDLFACPAVGGGGAPRTNPGPDPCNWRAGQVDERGNACDPSRTLTDKQAPRMAYTANAAILPRNRFTPALAGGGPRVNQLVAADEINRPGATILITEFINDWSGVAEAGPGGLVSRSHRPVSPFYSPRQGSEDGLYALDPRVSDLQYGTGAVNFGLLPFSQVADTPELITGKQAFEINAIGRHHPGGDGLGGAANFLYADGRVDGKPVAETLKNREWGERYYSLTGTNTLCN